MKDLIDIALEDVQKEYDHRKNEVCTRLLTIRDNCPNGTYCDWLLDTINFIQEEKKWNL